MVKDTKHIPVKCLEEIKSINMQEVKFTEMTGKRVMVGLTDGSVKWFTTDPIYEWHDNNGINTPYLVSTIGGTK